MLVPSGHALVFMKPLLGHCAVSVLPTVKEWSSELLVKSG